VLCGESRRSDCCRRSANEFWIDLNVPILSPLTLAIVFSHLHSINCRLRVLTAGHLQHACQIRSPCRSRGIGSCLQDLPLPQEYAYHLCPFQYFVDQRASCAVGCGVAASFTFGPVISEPLPHEYLKPEGITRMLLELYVSYSFSLVQRHTSSSFVLRIRHS
jgi:hypothetical protein